MTMLIKQIADIRNQIAEFKQAKLTVGLVPTMGALHKGHISLIEASKKQCDRTVVSVFVNPTQFGPNEDFSSYPRTLEADFQICKELGVDLVFAPSAAEMYGTEEFGSLELSDNMLTYVIPPFSYVDALCGKTRTHHFDGVATVVTKLFNIVTPDKAFFGLKDIQQFIIIKKMVKDLNFNVELVGCEIIRDTNGLALSSRNKGIPEHAADDALKLSKMLGIIKEHYEKGTTNTQDLFDTAIQILNKNIELEYLDFVEYDNLQKTDRIKSRTIVAVAAKVCGVRLIDNIVIGK